jgi:hypothetical protein
MPDADGRRSVIREYLRAAFRWRGGRQRSGYEKMLLLQSPFPLPFDVYLLRFRESSEIQPHTDPVALGRHYRCNIVLWRARRGGEFVCANPIFASRRVKVFRPDASEHSVTRVEQGVRYVLSVGWIRPAPSTEPPNSA